MGALSTNKGKVAERHLVRWLRENGFGGAERAVRTGYRIATRTSADPGDVTGTPGIIWSCKDVAEARARQPSVLDGWFAELDAMAGEPDDVRLLVHKRAGHADPGRWWCWLRMSTLVPLATGGHSTTRFTAQVRMELADVVRILRLTGYGDEIDTLAG